METIALEKPSTEKLRKIFGLKSYDEVLEELNTSRKQASSGKLISANSALKELRTKYGL